ncbi:fused MFS/spermidine synthase [Terracidiphilus gabretensis]|uniref:fused MFS/spermidine synthase n=1 Tax=Terracidiphilus gabretensis TaxID=1577687 RepID=UPI000A9454DF|nr:fused MFS/spermidine synthase [Terracidiphilus gabretensis]
MPRVGIHLSIALFLSGAAALIYQILWIRQLSLVVGVEVYSITIAVSAFFAGLAGGSLIFGRMADRWQRPLRLYGVLEICVALSGVLVTFLSPHAASPFVALQAHVGAVAWLLPFLLVGSPAFLMGGTLPAMIRYVAQRQSSVATSSGWVYAVNTAGGIAGALLSTFVFLRWTGVHNTAIAAAIFNLTAAAIVWFADRTATEQRPTHSSAIDQDFPAPSGQATLALSLYAVAGAVALGYEVVWSQALAQFMSTRVFAFSVELATYLAGLAIGSAIYARFGRMVRDTWGIFALLITGAGAIALLEIAALGTGQLRIQYSIAHFVFTSTGSEFARMCASFAVAAFGVVFLPTLLLGAAFPALLQLVARGTRIGTGTGTVLALNTAGGIVGSLLTGFLLIPTLGLVRTLSILAIIAATVGVLAVLLGSSVLVRWKSTIVLLAVGVVAASMITPQDKLARLLLLTRGGGDLVFYRESRGGTVAISQQQNADHIFRRLYIQGVSNSGDTLPSMRYMRLQALLPLIIHRGNPQSSLVIGFGTGITAGATLRYTGLTQRTCVELLSAVVDASSLFPENYGAGTDRNLNLRIRDGRQELLSNSAQYDMITLEPPPPSAEGVVNLYSTDFYKLAGHRLTPNGLFAQWLPISTQNEDDTRSLIRSFLDVFPYATLWTTEVHEMLLIGSFSPIDLDVSRIQQRFDQPNVTAALNAVGISSPAALLATWLTGREGLEAYAGKVSPVTDNEPRIEYAAWTHPNEITRTLPHLLALQTEPPLENASEDLRVQIRTERSILAGFYAASLAAYKGDRDAWSEAMQKVMTGDNKNPYYNWLAGGQ